MAITNSIRLTDTQKKVLSIVKSASTPTLAFGDIAKGDDNVKQAKDMLADSGQFNPPLLNIDGNQMTVSDAGEQMMKDENLVDDMGELTPDAKALLGGNGQDAQSNPTDQMGTTDNNGNDLALPPDEQTEPNPFESLDFFKQINDLTYLK